MSRNTGKKNHAVLIVLIIALVVAAVAVGCALVKPYNDGIRDSWETKKEKAMGELDGLIQEYKDRDRQSQDNWKAERDRILNPPAQPEDNPSWPQAKAEGWDILDLSDFPLDNITREVKTRAELMYNGLLLVNEWHSRPADFDESGLKKLSDYLGGNEKVQLDNYKIRLFAPAADALLEAVNAAKAEGLDYYIVSEGYRSWDTQNEMFTKKKDQLAAKYTNEEDLIAAAKKDVNYPGTSEFNSGLSYTMRLYKKGDDEVNSLKYSTSEQGVWMNENCWKYGLVFRFPGAEWPLPDTLDKSHITGVSAKLNLYRYVGKAHAAVMHYMDLCLEEYIEYLHQHPHIALYEDGVLKYEIYCQYVGDAESVTVDLTPASAHVSSLDNMGYVVTAFER